jgi:hypothetical protein
MMTFSAQAIELWAKTRPLGYAEDVYLAGEVTRDATGTPLSVSLTEDAYKTLCLKYRGARPAASNAAPNQKTAGISPTSGPGTELKKLLKKVGITASPNCSCNARARRMDVEEARETGWCEAHLDEIVGWLREEAAKRGLPFLDVAGRVIVRRAISNARKEQARATQAATAEGREAT